VPLAALVAHRDVCCFEYGDQGGTFCGNPLMAAAGCAVIEEVTKPGFLARVKQAGDHLAGGLRELSRKHACGEVRGRGLLLALGLKRDIASPVADMAQERGLLINAPRPDSLRFMPALTVSDEEIDQLIDILDRVLRTWPYRVRAIAEARGVVSQSSTTSWPATEPANNRGQCRERSPGQAGG
jgi:acetylornithine/N-succinyldiaminopimelate aminotransferase